MSINRSLKSRLWATIGFCRGYLGFISTNLLHLYSRPPFLFDRFLFRGDDVFPETSFISFQYFAILSFVFLQ
jgi:hypothetical protein